MQASQALALERFLAGKGLAKKDIRRSPDEGGDIRRSLGEGGLLRASDLLPAFSRSSSSLLHTLPALDALFGGGLPDRKLIEVVGRRSSGRFSIALAALAAATTSGQDAALVDLGDQLDPQTAQLAGVDLLRLLWVRPKCVKEALVAAETLLSTGFRLVVADMGLSPRGGRFVPDAAWMRLQRAARVQRSTLLLLAPFRMSGIAADAVVSATAARPIWQGSSRASRLLSGISSRLVLEKLGREIPGLSGTLSLSVPEAVSCRLSRSDELQSVAVIQSGASTRESHVPLSGISLASTRQSLWVAES